MYAVTPKMETRKPPEYQLDISADRSNIKDVVQGILHTIFFHRYFTPLAPATHDILESLTLPYIPSHTDPDLHTLLETRTTTLLRHLDAQASSTTSKPAKCTLSISFLERKRRKGWFVAKADEETVWEVWLVHVTMTSARSEAEANRNRRVMERECQKAALKVVGVVGREKGHIPPITTNESNPFPYHVVVNPK